MWGSEAVCAISESVMLVLFGIPWRLLAHINQLDQRVTPQVCLCSLAAAATTCDASDRSERSNVLLKHPIRFCRASVRDDVGPLPWEALEPLCGGLAPPSPEPR
jgi:hypothetical protein